MNIIDFLQTGGYRLKQATFQRMQSAYLEVLKAFVTFIGIADEGNFIISGCKIVGYNITSGMLYIDGELCPFETAFGTSETKIKKQIEFVNLPFHNGTNLPVFRKTTAVVDATGIALSEFTRVTEIVALPQGIIIDPANLEADPPDKTVLERLLEVEKKVKIFTAGGVVFPWRKPISDIPPGFQEVTDLRGKTIFGMNIEIDPGTGAYIDPEFSPLTTGSNNPGRSGGVKKRSLVEANLPSFTLPVDPTAGGDSGGGAFATGDPTEGPINLEYEGAAEAFSILPPFETVIFIEYIG